MLREGSPPRTAQQAAGYSSSRESGIDGQDLHVFQDLKQIEFNLIQMPQPFIRPTNKQKQEMKSSGKISGDISA
jgi:hypothetical protein